MPTEQEKKTRQMLNLRIIIEPENIIPRSRKLITGRARIIFFRMNDDDDDDDAWLIIFNNPLRTTTAVYRIHYRGTLYV